MKLLMAVLLATQYERVLLPLVPTTADGAFGSRWETVLWMRNDSDQPVDAFPLSRDCHFSAFCFGSMREWPAFAPHQLGLLGYPPRTFGVGIPAGPTPGAFLYVERPDALSLQLHVRDTSRGARSFGTRIPVVPEGEFFTGTRDILAVPINPAARAALRVYTVGEGAILLRVEEMYGGRLVEARLDLQRDAANDRCTFVYSGCPDRQYKPAAIEITDLVQRFPELGEAVDSSLGVRIEIEPLTPGLAYWAMVTVTSNETNEVTLYLIR